MRGNELKAFSDAGGLRFGHGYRVNSYCRIKVPGLNVTFDCCIRARTDVPEFQLLCYQWDSAPPNESVHLVHLRDGMPGRALDERYNARPLRRYGADQLHDALADWIALAEFAASTQGHE